MRPNTRALLGAATAALLLCAAVHAQETGMKTMTFDASNTMIVPGLGAIIQMENDSLTVTIIPPADQRGQDYREVDIKSGDRVLMANGKKLHSIADFRNLFDSLEVGATVKLGIAREGRMMMASFKRADESAAGGPMMITRMEGGPGNEEENTWTMSDPNGVDGTVVVIHKGFIVAPSPDGLEVMMVLPEATGNLSGDLPAAGDRIISVNDIVEKDIHAFQIAWEKIPVGTDVKVVFERDKVRHEATFVKSEPQSGTTVIQHQ